MDAGGTRRADVRPQDRAAEVQDPGVQAPGVPAVQVWARDGRRTELAPGALDALRLLGVGRAIELIRSDGHRQRWRVSSVEPGTSPAVSDAIEVDDAGGLLTLTICGGAYLPELGGYERPVTLHCLPVVTSEAA